MCIVESILNAFYNRSEFEHENIKVKTFYCMETTIIMDGELKIASLDCMGKIQIYNETCDTIKAVVEKIRSECNVIH